MISVTSRRNTEFILGTELVESGYSFGEVSTKGFRGYHRRLRKAGVIMFGYSYAPNRLALGMMLVWALQLGSGSETAPQTAAF